MLAENNEEFSWLGNKIGGKYKKIYDDATRMTHPVSLLELEGKNVEEFKEILNQLEPKFKHLIIKNSDKIKFAKINAKGIGRTTSNGIYVNLFTDIFNEKGSWTTSLHEIGHAIDRIYKRPSHNVSFKYAIISDFTSFKKVYMLSSNVSESNIYIVLSEELCKTSKRESHILSDLFGALTNNQCVGESKHSNDYWEKKYSLEQEAFAHFF